MEICSNCNCKTNTIYDLFGDGLILYCEKCYIQWLAQQKRLIGGYINAKTNIHTKNN